VKEEMAMSEQFTEIPVARARQLAAQERLLNLHRDVTYSFRNWLMAGGCQATEPANFSLRDATRR